jgi:hypothetical protein
MPSLSLLFLVVSLNKIGELVMITIKIGTAERRDGDIDAGWISGQVNARRIEGKKFCVFFKVN